MQHGRHVKIVGRGEPDKLRSVDGVRAMLEALVARVGMRLLNQAHMYEVEEELHKIGAEPFEDEGGVTGVAVLSTSHCSIHTWPLRAHFVMDVYSCRDFDAFLVEQALIEHFGAYMMRITDLSDSLIPLEDELGPQPVVQA